MTIQETLCPICKGKMVSRQNRTNGQFFWGCATYPACKGTRDTDGFSKEEREASKATKGQDRLGFDKYE